MASDATLAGEPRFTHVRVLVADYAECFAFYRDVLGFEATFGDADSGYADLATGDATVALFDRAEMAAAVDTVDTGSPDGGDDGTMLVFAVPDVDATAETLREAGVDLAAEPEDHPEWGIRTVHARDPAGTLLEFNEPLEG